MKNINPEIMINVDPTTAFSLVGLLYLLLALVTGVHVVLNKQNEASAFSWLGIILLAPLMGALLYWLFGMNRIRRRAQAELSDHSNSALSRSSVDSKVPNTVFSRLPEAWQSMMRFGLGVHQAPYLPRNQVDPLINGDEAYPQMIRSIEGARASVILSSYIFEFDATGIKFINALVAAHKRGVAVRVLIDGVGVGYGFSLVRVDRVLRKEGVKTNGTRIRT